MEGKLISITFATLFKRRDGAEKRREREKSSLKIFRKVRRRASVGSFDFLLSRVDSEVKPGRDEGINSFVLKIFYTTESLILAQDER